MRAIVPPLTATQATILTRLALPSGVPWQAQPSDWIITHGSLLVDIVDDRTFRTKYEPVVEGTLLPRTICTQIEEITGVGTTQTPEALVHAIDRLARIAIGDVQIRFTPGQLEEITHRARKRGLTITQELQRIVDRIKDELFYKS